MQVYTLDHSFAAGEPFTIGVQPNTRFALAIYVQGGGESLESFSAVSPVETSAVTQALLDGRLVFESGGDSAPMAYDQDWGWPTITLRPDAPVIASGAYMVVAYEVDAAGAPVSDLGRRCAAGAPLHGYPPDSDAMALVICRPAKPTAAFAYVVPTATYHAYNSTGGGCFYDDHVHGTTAQWQVSLCRPGGGLGAQQGEPPDPYDPGSPRQQFTHWDAKFIRWLIAQGIACDFYTDFDLHTGALDLAAYRCMLSVGHHEYWSEAMRGAVARFVQGGGNLAIFSGNTCYRPIDFGDPEMPGCMTIMRKRADHWPDYNESELLGLSYGFGGGHWGDWDPQAGWVNTGRDPIGFTVRDANHWVFAGCGLAAGETFGATDRLIGYEVDGLPPRSTGFNILADTRRLTGWEMEGVGALGIYGSESAAGPKTGLVFNGGTTDWARVLMDKDATAHDVVSRITANVLSAFSGS